MSISSSNTKQKAGVAAIVITLMLSIAGVVAAQSGPANECSDNVATFGTQFFGLEDGGNRLLSTSPTSREFTLATPLLAGDYELNAVSYDGYEQRETIAPQPQEQWFVEFLAADASIVATSGITADLIDEVTEDTWSGSLGAVTLSDTATSVRVVHAAPGSSSVNSVRPVCLGASGGPAPTTTSEAPVVPAPESSVTVNFTSTAAVSSNVSIGCGDLQESALGTEINLLIDSIPGLTDCAVEYPAGLDCLVAVDPNETSAASSAGVQNLLIPASGNVDIVVTISCGEVEVAATPSPTTTAAPTPVTVAPTVEVAGQVETAPTATAQAGQPAFTG